MAVEDVLLHIATAPSHVHNGRTVHYIDPHTGKSNPEVDVVTLVDLALAKSGTGTVGPEELHEATGWPLRRFNPPFAYMVSQIDDRRVLKGGTDDYGARGFLMIDSDRVALHRFAARLLR